MIHGAVKEKTCCCDLLMKLIEKVRVGHKQGWLNQDVLILLVFPSCCGSAITNSNLNGLIMLHDILVNSTYKSF